MPETKQGAVHDNEHAGIREGPHDSFQPFHVVQVLNRARDANERKTSDSNACEERENEVSFLNRHVFSKQPILHTAVNAKGKITQHIHTYQSPAEHFHAMSR